MSLNPVLAGLKGRIFVEGTSQFCLQIFAGRQDTVPFQKMVHVALSRRVIISPVKLRSSRAQGKHFRQRNFPILFANLRQSSGYCPFSEVGWTYSLPSHHYCTRQIASLYSPLSCHSVTTYWQKCKAVWLRSPWMLGIVAASRKRSHPELASIWASHFDFFYIVQSYLGLHVTPIGH